MNSGEYFLGLIILTEENGRKNVVDGQQRLVTLTLLAAALCFEARKLGRKALAERIEADFIRSIDYDTDNEVPRIFLSDENDNSTFLKLIETGNTDTLTADEDSVSARIINSFKYLQRQLREDLKQDAFKRLGRWTDFITNQLYFAVFIHPDAASAYTVFEVVNTRGRELTTADLLKNYILSQTRPDDREKAYLSWKSISRNFTTETAGSTFVQFIRHSVTVEHGHVLPKDLYAFLSGKRSSTAPSPPELIDLLERRLPLYRQIEDPSAAGPAVGRSLEVFRALNSLNILTVRPLLLALHELDDWEEGFDFLLRLVVRRIVVGNLGTGNIERRLADAAKKIFGTRDWEVLKHDLADLNPPKDEFQASIGRRSYSKPTLAFLRRSVLQNSITPKTVGVLHWIWPRQTADWDHLTEENAYWSATAGNSVLADLETRPSDASENWRGFKQALLPQCIDSELKAKLAQTESWNVNAIEEMGGAFASIAADLWYGANDHQ